MKQAGFDPRGLIDLFEVLSKEQGPTPFMGTHPDPLDRAKRIRSQLNIAEDAVVNLAINDDDDVIVIPFPLKNDR